MKKRTNEEIEKTIKEAVLNEYNAMYDTYSNGTDEFFNYFENGFVRVDTKGNLGIGVEQPKKEWNDFLSNYSMKLISFDPTQNGYRFRSSCYYKHIRGVIY